MPFHPLIAAAALFPLLAAFPVSVAQTSGQTAASPEVILGARDRYDRLTVPVRIGSHGPYRFIIDTGAERTILARKVVEQMGLTTSSTGLLIGVAGSQQVDLVEVEEISLGRRTFYTLTAPVLDGVNIGADGIVGLDSLQNQRVLLDFANNRMAIDDAAALGGNRGYDIIVSARRRSGQLIMANATVDGVRTDVVIDTGADVTIGNPALQRALSRRNKSSTTQLTSVTGQQITADIGLARAIEIGGLQLQNTTLVFAKAPAFDKLGLSNKPAMLLGMAQLRLFKRVAIDFASKRILFDLPSGETVFPATAASD